MNLFPSFHRSLRAKILLAYGALWSLLFLTVGVSFYHLVSVRLREKMSQQLLAAGSAAVKELEHFLPDHPQPDFFSTGPSKLLNNRMQSLARTGVLENLAILDGMGNVLMDLTGEAVPGFTSPWLKATELERIQCGFPVALPVYQGDFDLLHQSAFLPMGPGYILEVDADPHFLDILNDFGKTTFWFGCFGLFACLLVSLLVARTILRPVEQVVRMAEGVAGGIYSFPRPTHRDDELGRLAQALEIMSDKVQARENELKEIAGGIAHEVRNPLGIIRGEAEWILEETLDKNSSQAKSAAKIREQVGVLNQVVTGFLEFGRGIHLNLQSTDLAEWLPKWIDLISSQASQQAVKLVLQAEKDSKVLLDRDLFFNVFHNLALNAFQAMPDGGVLILRWSSRWEKGLLEVEDTGPGVSPENRPQLFKPFFTTKEKGTGLGLAWIGKIIQAHGGRVEYKEGSRGGALFCVYLPLEVSRV